VDIRRTLKIEIDGDPARLELILKAINAPNRLRILHFLSDKVASVNEIAQALDLPMSTAALYVELLEESGLIYTELEPASRGQRKVCTRLYDQLIFDFPVIESKEEKRSVELTMPIGAFTDCQVVPTCGMLGEHGPIGMFDDPASFYENERIQAQLLWFSQGYVEYRFPNRIPPTMEAESLHLTMEVCSEAPLYNLDWPSDITVWINGVEIGTWTCPSDFGGEAGLLTPDWWSPRNTQYGLLKVWHVNGRGAKVDGTAISNVTIDSLKLKASPYIGVRIGVKADASYVGGINLFGSRFGNYPQDLVLRIGYGSPVQPPRSGAGNP
jgi:predicted transcriptional regulator